MSEKHPPVQLCSVFSIRVCPPFDSVILPRSSIAPSHRNESSPQAQAQTKSAKEILRCPYATPLNPGHPVPAEGPPAKPGTPRSVQRVFHKSVSCQGTTSVVPNKTRKPTGFNP